MRTWNKPELLAPAGNISALKAAVECGADAVYLGSNAFNARLKSDNFDKNDFENAVDYAHSKDVFVYLALNTLIRDDEIERAFATATFAANKGVDAIIVQDIGLASLINSRMPEVKIHASTQMSICDINGVKFAETLGAKRVVLARELSINEISQIAKQTELELEVFVHGALCISVSGQCLMSSLQGGRSGNRGICAQPCRLPYDSSPVGGHKTAAHLLSPKDLCGLFEIPRLISAGVKTFKIEGRLKSEDYVAATTSIYRKYIDLACSEEKPYSVDERDIEILMQTFNRGGYSSGWLNEGASDTIMCIGKPKNWGIHIGSTCGYSNKSLLIDVNLEKEIEIGDGVEIWNGEEISPGGIISNIKKDGKHVKNAVSGEVVSIGEIRGEIRPGMKVYKTSSKSLKTYYSRLVASQNRKVEIDAEISFKLGESVELFVRDIKGNSEEVISEIKCELPQKVTIDESRVLQQLRKTGDTPFEFGAINVNIEGEIFFPLSEISAIRRLALEKLNSKRIEASKRNILQKSLKERTKIESTLDSQSISVFYYQKPNKNIHKNHSVSRIYIPINEISSSVEAVSEGCEVFAWLPVATMQSERSIIDKLVYDAFSNGIKGLLLGGIGDLKYSVEYPSLKIALNYGFNAFNSYSIDVLKANDVTVSPELNLEQIKKIEGENLELVVFGKLVAMNSAKELNLNNFEILPSQSGRGSVILSSEPIDLVREVSRMRNIKNFRIDVSDQSEEMVDKIIAEIEKEIRRN
ncbi:MAG: U32 family peptidase [Bacillota bacterium]